MRRADISFVAGCGEIDEKTITLKIENFSEFLKMSNTELKANGIVFKAGECTWNDGKHYLAPWKYYFENTKQDEEDWVGGFLLFDRDNSGVKSAKAWHSVSLSSGGKLITSFTAECNEYAISGWGKTKLIRKAEILEKTKGDVLEVTLLVKVFSENSFNPVEIASSNYSSEKLRGQMTSDLTKMLDSGDGANVEIKVPSEIGGDGNDPWYTKQAHKGILMARSSVFAKMFAKDSTMVEAKTGEVVIKDLSPKGLDVFLYYLYTGEVAKDWGRVGPEILNAAEKYDCEQLKEYCGLNMMSVVSTSNAMELYKSAKLHGLADAAKKVAGFISENTEAVLHHVVEGSK